MPRRDKITVAILAVVFIISIGQFIVRHLRLPASIVNDIFVEGVVGRIRTINPLFVDFSDTDRDLSTLIFSGLMRYDPQQKNFFPDIAASWDRSSNGLSYSFTLRTDAKWHDGTPVTAEDVLFTFNDVIRDPGFRNPILRNAFEGVSVAHTEANKITFTLPKANSFFISNLTVGILPKHLLENTAIANLDKSAFGQRPIGSGPYQFDSGGSDMVDLVAFPDYYGKKPTLPRIRFLIFREEKDLQDSRGALHAFAKSTTATRDERFTLYPYTLNQFTALYFNTQSASASDKKMRTILLRALDKNAIVPPGSKRIDALDIANHQEDARFLFDAKASAALLETLGWKIGADGIRANSKGDTLSLQLLTNSKMPAQISDAITTYWSALGVKVTVERIEEPDVFYQHVNERRYDALLINQNLGYNRDVYSLFHSSQAGGIGLPDERSAGLNFSNFKSFRTDGLTEAMRKERDPPSKEKLLIELGKVLADENPVIFISTPVYSYAIDKRFSPFSADSLDYHSDRLLLTPYL